MLVSISALRAFPQCQTNTTFFTHVLKDCRDSVPNHPQVRFPRLTSGEAVAGNMMRDTPRIFVWKGAVMSFNVCYCSVLGRAEHESRDEDKDDMADAIVVILHHRHLLVQHNTAESS